MDADEQSPGSSRSPIEELAFSPSIQALHNPPTVDDDDEMELTHLNTNLGNQLVKVQKDIATKCPSKLLKRTTKILSQLVWLSAGLCYDTALESIVT
jgi:hypothetical protein